MLTHKWAHKDADFAFSILLLAQVYLSPLFSLIMELYCLEESSNLHRPLSGFRAGNVWRVKNFQRIPLSSVSWPTSSSYALECDVGSQVEGSHYPREGNVVLVVDDGRTGRDEDIEPDGLDRGGGLAVVHPAPVPPLVRYGEGAHLQARQ